jgi:hypothetical protein
MPVLFRPFAGRRTLSFAAKGLLGVALAAAVSCGQPVDLKQALQVTDVSGGWYDFGIVDGKNKLVPSLTLRIRKPADVRLRSVSLNVHFKKVIDPSKPGVEGEQEFDEVFLQTVEFTDGTQTALLTVRPTTGFTGDAPQSRAEMLQHRQFQDIRARVFAKQSSTTWVDLLAFDIPRTILTK